jgi:hypothetical protein
MFTDEYWECRIGLLKNWITVDVRVYEVQKYVWSNMEADIAGGIGVLIVANITRTE